MKRLNKKGFTLVELLAVIVILALLIVVVANTALPAMNNAKKNTLETYSKRVVEEAKTLFMSAQVSGSSVSQCVKNNENKMVCTFTELSQIMGNDVDTTYSLDGNLTITEGSNGNYTITGKIKGNGYATTISTSDNKVTYATA